MNYKYYPNVSYRPEKLLLDKLAAETRSKVSQVLRQLKFEDRQTFGIYQQRPPFHFPTRIERYSEWY